MSISFDCLRPSHLTQLAGDALGLNGPMRPSSEHLDAAMRWLCRAQDAAAGGGVAAAYSLLRGWEAPYPETTGYIIPTFLDFARFSGDEEYRRRAVRMGEWLLEIQMDSGAFQAGYYRGPADPSLASVFNTGQILLGLCRLHRETLDVRYGAAARRAADWLVRMQGADGAWYRGLSFHGPNTPVRSYYVRVAWALMEAAALDQADRCREAAARNVRWVLGQQQDNGWFRNNAFRVGSDPFTHTIAYVLEGLLGYAEHTGDPSCIEAVRKTATKLMTLFELRPHFPGEFGADWRSAATYRCLTGEAQIAGVWLKLYALTSDVRFLNSALKLLDRLKRTQSLRSSNPGIRGGVKGSHPTWGRYHRASYVCWGAKFFADALLAETDAMRKLEGDGTGR
jgi:uncharacterized protein YyaL (SSP411 family)